MKTRRLNPRISNFLRRTLRRLAAFGLLILSAFLLLSCKREPDAASADQLPDALAPAQASVQIEKTFAGTKDVWAKNTAKTAVDALKNKQYDVAFAALQQLKNSGKLAPQEDMAVRNAILGTSIAGVKAMESGDAKAAEMMKNIKAIR